MSIFLQLTAAGMSANGAYAMMGNMMAESGMKANIAQRGLTTLSDEAYTAKFDKDPDSCIYDSIGYGYCQWTYHSRKHNLWQFCSGKGKSVGDGDTQVDFIVYELKSEYAELWDYLCRTEDLYEATARICKEYERPAVNNIQQRYSFALKFASENPEPEPDPPKEQDLMTTAVVGLVQSLLMATGYGTELTGIVTDTTIENLTRFVNDLSKLRG